MVASVRIRSGSAVALIRPVRRHRAAKRSRAACAGAVWCARWSWELGRCPCASVTVFGSPFLLIDIYRACAGAARPARADPGRGGRSCGSQDVGVAGGEPPAGHGGVFSAGFSVTSCPRRGSVRPRRHPWWQGRSRRRRAGWWARSPLEGDWRGLVDISRTFTAIRSASQGADGGPPHGRPHEGAGPRSPVRDLGPARGGQLLGAASRGSGGCV